MRRRGPRLVALLAVLGPGLLAGLSDDDPAGITTYSVLGAEHGYRLLWVLALSTVALVLFHDLGARLGIVTGQGIAGLTREAYGVRRAAVVVAALVVANVGTTCAEFAGIAAGLELFGLTRYVSVPVAAVVVSWLVLRGSFRRVEHVLLAVSAVFVMYVAAGIIAGPQWGAAFEGLVVPRLPETRDAVVLATATLGTTLAPWGLSFLQSYAADKRLTVDDLRYERVDVVVGAVLTGVIGFFVVVACAATLNRRGVSIDDAADAARALRPAAGSAASGLFGAGLVGAALLAASILPLSTAYSVGEFVGRETALDATPREASVFYGTFAAVTVIGAGVVLIPGLPLVPVLVATQVVNAVLLLPLLLVLRGIARDPTIMGDHVATRAQSVAYAATSIFVALCIVAMVVLTVV